MTQEVNKQNLKTNPNVIYIYGNNSLSAERWKVCVLASRTVFRIEKGRRDQWLKEQGKRRKRCPPFPLPSKAKTKKKPTPFRNRRVF